jgi:hypothetical protein
MMEEHEYKEWIDRIIIPSVLEDIIYTCNSEETHMILTKHHYPPDALTTKLDFYKKVAAYATGRALELAISFTDTNCNCKQEE